MTVQSTLSKLLILCIAISTIACNADKKSASTDSVAEVSSEVKSPPPMEEFRRDTKEAATPEATLVSNPEEVASTSVEKPKTVAKPKPKSKPKPAKKSKPVRKSKTIEFAQESFDFGDIVEGEIINQKFEFTNLGARPLEITGADASCGCAVPSVPFLALEKGDTGFIGIRFNSVGKHGPQDVEIIIESTGHPKNKVLKMTGTVYTKEELKAKTEAAKKAEEAKQKAKLDSIAKSNKELVPDTLSSAIPSKEASANSTNTSPTKKKGNGQ